MYGLLLLLAGREENVRAAAAAGRFARGQQRARRRIPLEVGGRRPLGHVQAEGQRIPHEGDDTVEKGQGAEERGEGEGDAGVPREG